MILDSSLGRQKIKQILENPDLYQGKIIGGTPIGIFACKQCTDKLKKLVKIDIIPKMSGTTLKEDKQGNPISIEGEGGIDYARCSECNLDYYNLPNEI